MTIFRWFNRIETGERVVDLLLNGWDRDEAYQRLARVKGALWTGAYRIRGENGVPKLESTLDSIEIARSKLPAMVARWGPSLREAWLDLRRLPYLGNFMAYEVVTDLRWTPVLSGAKDVETWAAAGPGCAAGLGWVEVGDLKKYDYHSDRDQAAMLPLMRDLLEMSSDPEYWPYTDAPWELREVEMWLCEVAKYIRCRDGGRPPRQRYRPPSDTASGQASLFAFA